MRMCDPGASITSSFSPSKTGMSSGMISGQIAYSLLRRPDSAAPAGDVTDTPLAAGSVLPGKESGAGVWAPQQQAKVPVANSAINRVAGLRQSILCPPGQLPTQGTSKLRLPALHSSGGPDTGFGGHTIVVYWASSYPCSTTGTKMTFLNRVRLGCARM